MSEVVPPVSVSSVPMTWADIAYGAAAPVVFAGVRLGARVLGVSPADLQQRAGAMPDARAPLLWFHGASAGEMMAAARLVRVLRETGYQFSAGYTATNEPGLAVARRAVSPLDVVALAPWDAPRWVARALERWRPRALFLVETELWPRLVFDAHRQSIPVFSVSARMYPRDAGRYRWVRPFIPPTVSRLSLVLAQNEADRARFVGLGAEPEHCIVAGDLKHATSRIEEPLPSVGLRAELELRVHDRVIVCGSMHANETELLVTALTQVEAPDVRFVVAPRHAEGVTAVLAAAHRHGWRTFRRTCGAPAADWQLLILDTHGELTAAYGLATAAVVGGSFSRHGGHNLLEPVRAGAPVLFGPHTMHVADDALRLLAHAPEARVSDAGALAARLRAWLADDDHRRGVLARQQRALPDGVAIANQYVAVLSPWLRGMGLERT